jgi:hypothetical protein
MKPFLFPAKTREGTQRKTEPENFASIRVSSRAGVFNLKR